jgi:hypothetical protein
MLAGKASFKDILMLAPQYLGGSRDLMCVTKRSSHISDLVCTSCWGVEQRGKLLLKIPVRELHNDMLLPLNKDGFAGIRDEDGQIIISDTLNQNFDLWNSILGNLSPQHLIKRN